LTKENEIFKNQIDFSNKDRDSIHQTNQNLLNEKNSLINLINTLNQKNESLKKENYDLNQNIQLLKIEIENSKKENENKIFEIQKYYEKDSNDKINSIINEYNNKTINVEDNLKFANKLLEKRLINLQTQMDLKDIQIKSQEEIINRRNKMLNDSISINVNSSERNDESLIKNLENDKEKLISDNVVLINDNQLLKEQINILNNELFQKNMIIQNFNQKMDK
jgi:hypothetical protein